MDEDNVSCWWFRPDGGLQGPNVLDRIFKLHTISQRLVITHLSEDGNGEGFGSET